jgi:predicted DNA-binding transcriptional regulator AlpA
MQTITIKQLAVILNRSPATIATEASKTPEKLPPRLILPGSRRVLWLKEDVEAWLKAHRNRKDTGDVEQTEIGALRR